MLVIDEGLLKALSGEDALGVVIRSHIHIESLLNKFLECHIKNLEAWNDRNFSYGNKLNIADVFFFRPNPKGSLTNVLKQFGSIRNKFAHQPDTKLTKAHIDHLHHSLSEIDKELTNKTFDLLKATGWLTSACNIKQESPRVVFMMIALLVAARLTMLIEDAKQSSADSKAEATGEAN